jgi:hypothetical protein
MMPSHSRSVDVIASFRHIVVLAGSFVGTLLSGCASTSPDYAGARAFPAPEEAVTALAEAAKAGNAEAIREIFGPDSEQVLSSGDPVVDRHNLETFAVAISDGWSLRRIDGSTRELTVGPEAWPFPIPLEKDRHGWWFNTTAGKQEVLARRIGRNELAAIGTLRTYVIAQREYAGAERDGRPAGIYAQRVRSEPGRRNGLFWPTAGPQEKPSPLGEFAAQAEAQGYRPDQTDGIRPYNGRQAQRPRSTPSSPSSRATAPAPTSGAPPSASSTPPSPRPTAASARSTGTRSSPARRPSTRPATGSPTRPSRPSSKYLVGIKGPLTTPVGGGIRSLNVALRQMLDLYVCLRPVRWFKGVPSPVKRPQDCDMVIFRENTEDIYAGIELAAGTPEAAKVLDFMAKEFPKDFKKIRFGTQAAREWRSMLEAIGGPQASRPP